jgi:hypothetical protein
MYALRSRVLGSTVAGICEPKANNNRSWTVLPPRRIRVRARTAALARPQKPDHAPDEARDMGRSTL